MPDQRADLVRKMIAEGTSDEDIRATLKVFDAQGPAEPPDDRSYLEQVKDRFTSGLGRAVKNPSVGAGLAAAVAAPFTGGLSIPAAMGAMGAAGAGGSVLTGARDVPTMAKEGALVAGGEGLARGVAGLAKMGGKLIYKAALRPSMGLQREFGDVAETGLREAAPVTQGGVKKITGRLTQNAGKVGDLIADAEKAGASPVSTKEVAGEFGDVFRQGRNQAALGRPDPRAAVRDRLSAFNARNPGGMPLGRAQELKGEAQDLASKAYRAEDLGHPLTDLSAASDKAMARGLRKGIEARAPGVGPINAHSQELIGLTRALEDATKRNVPGVGSLRSLLGDFVPSLSSRGGIALDRVGKSNAMPAAFRTALLAALGVQE